MQSALFVSYHYALVVYFGRACGACMRSASSYFLVLYASRACTTRAFQSLLQTSAQLTFPRFLQTPFQYSGFIHGLVSIVRVEGVKGLFKGAGVEQLLLFFASRLSLARARASPFFVCVFVH